MPNRKIGRQKKCFPLSQRVKAVSEKWIFNDINSFRLVTLAPIFFPHRKMELIFKFDNSRKLSQISQFDDKKWTEWIFNYRNVPFCRALSELKLWQRASHEISRESFYLPQIVLISWSWVCSNTAQNANDMQNKIRCNKRWN